MPESWNTSKLEIFLKAPSDAPFVAALMMRVSTPPLPPSMLAAFDTVSNELTVNESAAAPNVKVFAAVNALFALIFNTPAPPVTFTTVLSLARITVFEVVLAPLTTFSTPSIVTATVPLKLLMVTVSLPAPKVTFTSAATSLIVTDWLATPAALP